MPKGISLHIGLNYVDPDHYSGWDGKLMACENDARDMQKIARSMGYSTNLLIREQATRERVVRVISSTAYQLEKGDIFYISYSGHGGSMPDRHGDEEDGMDETWALWDGHLIDDQLRELWSRFKEGVRILVTSDSCHSGTVIRAIEKDEEGARKQMPFDIAVETYQKNRAFYDEVLRSVPKVKSSDIRASVKLISGCQDNQYSYDGFFNGQFTGKLKEVWNDGRFRGNYYQFHKEISRRMPSNQTPNHTHVGHRSRTFEMQSPFQI